jgi:uncharacterized protein with ParB-like and HNH nuclease domain
MTETDNIFKIPEGASDFLPDRAHLHQLQSGLGKYIVPLYQRTYRWDNENCEQFLEDIFNIVFSDNTDHFFNSMVFIKDKNTQVRTIVDGQQRLITSILLFNAKVQLFGGNFELKEKQFLIQNEKNHNNSDGFDFADFFINPQNRNGYSLETSRMIVDAERVQNWKEIICYCASKTVSSRYLSYIDEISEDFESILNNPKHKELLEKYFQENTDIAAVFTSNYEFGLQIAQQAPQSVFLLANVLLFCLHKEGKSKKDKNITDFKQLTEMNLPNETLKKAAISILFCSEDKKLRSRLRNGEIHYGNLTDMYLDWLSSASLMLNHFLQFYAKFDEIFNKKKNPKQPYVSNYAFIINFLRKKYEEYIQTIVKRKIDLKSFDLFKHSNYNLKDFFSNLLDKAFEHSFFITVEVSNPDEKIAIDLALTAFSSINSAGEPLESFDIIKSDLYGKCSTAIYERMNEFLAAHQDTLNMRKDELLKFFFAAENADYKKEKIYRQFRNYIKKEEDSRPRTNAHEAFVKRFMDFCEVKYQADNGVLLDDEGVFQYLASLHLLASLAKKIQTLYALMFAIVKSDYKFEEKIRIFNAIYARFLIYSLAGDNKSIVNIFESFIAKAKISTALPDFLRLIDDKLYVGNLKAELGIRLMDKKHLYNETGKHITIIREGYARATTSNMSYKALKVNFNMISGDSSIEHIYHRSAPKGAVYAGYVGNFTLLERNQNSSASDKQYAEKIGHHLDSGLVISRIVLQHHIDDYNRKNPDDPTNLDKFKYERVSSENNHPKFKTVISSEKGNDITSQFSTSCLDLEWLVGDIDDPDNLKPGGLMLGIIEILSSNESILSAVSELEKNPNTSCNTLGNFTAIKFITG